MLKTDDRLLPYFFETFLGVNNFVSVNTRFNVSLLDTARSSIELRDAISAISSLHFSRHHQLQRNIQPSPSDHIEALQAYARSVRSVQAKISSRSFINAPSSLWTTFLLGIFELMRDSTGTNWLAHFLHGTSTILRLLTPSILTDDNNPLNVQRRNFLFATRVFELARALIYTSPTFLSSPEWQVAIDAYWTSGKGARTPKEALFDMLPDFGDLGMRTLKSAEGTGIMSPQDPEWHLQRELLAHEGLVLQRKLQTWHHTTSAITVPSSTAPDTELSISLLYYHAISIYLDGTFSYHPPFTTASAPHSPIIARVEVVKHVDQILCLSRELLARGVAGVFLFFPLRVAGARAKDWGTREEILGLLEVIARRGFLVARAFVEDLGEVWGR
jgi:hypothetical protein